MKTNTQPFTNSTLGHVNRLAQFAFPAPTALKVSLAGDFNNWDTKAAPMHRAPDGGLCRLGLFCGGVVALVAQG